MDSRRPRSPAPGGPGGREPARPGGRPPEPATAGGTALAVGGYVALFLLGLVQALLGTFFYSRGPGLLVPILFDAAILATCVLGSSGMCTALGGVLPAIGWFVTTLALTSNTADGSVIVSSTSAGEWYLFGGALCAAVGAVYAFARWSRPSRERRAGRASGPGGSPR